MDSSQADHATVETEKDHLVPSTSSNAAATIAGLSPSFSSSSSSSSCLSSDDEDFFQLDLTKAPRAPPPAPPANAQPKNLDSPPPPQAMSRATDAAALPDPNRIPSSVFARTKSATPMEWSCASNESLFSIHLGGNASFSRDQTFLLKSGDLTNFQFTAASPMGSPGATGIAGGEADGRAVKAAEEANAEAMKDVMRATAAERKAAAAAGSRPPLLNSLSRNSDGSATSFRSFAFPILTAEGRGGSVKVVELEAGEKQVEQQSPHSETPKDYQNDAAAAASPPPAPAASKWFPCFTCSFCC